MCRSRPLSRPSAACACASSLRGGCALLVGACCSAARRAAPARAAVEGSPHDLIAQGYDVRQGLAAPGALQPLPPPLAAGAAGLPPRGPAGPRARLRRLEPRLLLLPRRHDDRQPRRGREPDRLSPASHGSDLAGYEGLRSEAVGLPVPGRQRAWSASPATTPTTTATGRSCAPTSGALPRLPLEARRVRPGQGEPHRQPHPRRSTPRRRRGAEVPLEDRRRLPDAVPRALPAAARARAPAAWHWDLGGHLAEGRSGAIACVTCHAVHGDEARRRRARRCSRSTR